MLSYRSLSDSPLLYGAAKLFELFTNKVVDFNSFSRLGRITVVYSVSISNASAVRFICEQLRNTRLNKVKVKRDSALRRCVCAGCYLRLCASGL